MKTDNNKELSDRHLSQLIKHNLLEAPPSPWFTRKVLNRLPERKIKVASLVEYSLYIIGIIITGIVTDRFVIHTISTGVITVGNLFTYAMLFTLFCSLIYLLISPWYTTEMD